MSPTTLAPESVTLSQTSTPDLTIINAGLDGPSRLSHFRGTPVVLCFRPLLWDPSRAEHVSLFNRLLARFLGPGERLEGATFEGVWCRLAFPDGAIPVALVTPRNPAVAAARANGAPGTGAVFLLDTRGMVRWRYFPPSGGSVPSDEILSALADLAPVTGGSSKALSRQEFVAATLAATLILSTRPNAGRASYRAVVPAMIYR